LRSLLRSHMDGTSRSQMNGTRLSQIGGTPHGTRSPSRETRLRSTQGANEQWNLALARLYRVARRPCPNAKGCPWVCPTTHASAARSEPARPPRFVVREIVSRVF
jgi:hypothetical protein